MQYSTLKSTHRENSYSSSDAANEFHTSSLTALSDSFGTCEHTESTTNSNKSVVRKARNIFLNYFFQSIAQLHLIMWFLTQCYTEVLQLRQFPPPVLQSSYSVAVTRSSAVAERPRDASCLSVVSFNSTIPWAQSFIISYSGFTFTNTYNWITFCCLRRNVEVSCHKHFVVRLPLLLLY